MAKELDLNSRSPSGVSETLYGKLISEDSSSSCEDIPERACVEAPGNFVRILICNGLTKIGDALASAKTLLPWMATAVGVPPYLIAWFVPIRESGSLIPQVAVAAFLRRRAVRKWSWVAGAAVQGLCVLGLAAIALTQRGVTAGLLILACLSLFSIARCFCSVAAKDVLGKTIPRGQRGQLTGWASSTAGLVTVAVAIALLIAGGPDAGRPDAGHPDVGRPDYTSGYLAEILLAAGFLWFAAALLYARIKEFPGETETGSQGLRSIFSPLSLLWSDPVFLRFIIARALLMSSALSAPFFVLLAQQSIGNTAALLGLLLLAQGAASLVSGPFWGRFADQSSRSVMVLASAISAGVALILCLSYLLEVPLIDRVWFIPAMYFLLGIAHAGIRIGRKTYVVDIATGNKRTDYVSLGNTVIGLLMLAAGSVGLLVPVIGAAGVIALLAALGMCGCLVSLTLPERSSSG